MRLLNAQTLKFEEYSDTKAPPYAILSHTWQAEEVSLQDFYRPDAATTAGYQKIKRFCQLAITSGLTYVWVDTCCIDKTSSAELSEAINSMFRWYEKSAICFAYLADVSAETESPSPLLTNSCWFTRGWTLQELLAPRVVLFIGSNWKVFGNRDSLAYQISAITGIGNRYLTTRAAEAHYRTSDEPYYDDYGGHLERLSHIHEATVAEKLSWAATRQTTREEDVAYCLLGLCAVNMPLLYGEGPAAFLRLQEAIIRQKFDPTLLAWNVVINDSRGRRVLRPENPVASSKWRSVGKVLFGLESPWSHRNGDEFRSLNFLCPGILAPSPICFSGCDQYVNLQATLDWDLTSRGLSISLPTSKNTNPCMLLPCHKRDDPWSLVAVPLIGFNDEFFDRAAAPVEFIDRQKWQIWLPRRLLLSTYAPMWNRIRQSNLETIRIYVDAKLQCLDLVASREVYRLSDGMGCEWANRRAHQPLFRLLIRSQETDKTYTVDVEATVIPSSQLRVLLPESMHVRFNHSVRSAGQATGLAPVDWDNWERVEMPKNINEPEPLLVTIRQVTSTQAPEYLLRISEPHGIITNKAREPNTMLQKYQESMWSLRKASEVFLEKISLLSGITEAYVPSLMRRLFSDILLLTSLSCAPIFAAWSFGLLSSQIQCDLWCVFLCSRIYNTIAWAGLVYVTTYRALPTICYLVPDVSHNIALYRTWIATIFIIPIFSDIILLPSSYSGAGALVVGAVITFLRAQSLMGYRHMAIVFFTGVLSPFVANLLTVPNISAGAMALVVGLMQFWIIFNNELDCAWFTVLWWYTSVYAFLPSRYTEQPDCRLNPFALLVEDGIRRYQLSIYGQQLYGNTQ